MRHILCQSQKYDMNFIHEPLQELEVIQHNLPSGRVYETPSGERYPSVTRVLGFESKASLEEWKSRVGKDEAELIGARAALRGTAIHAYAEDYLNNKIPDISIFDADMWRKLKPILNHINNIRLLEGKLFSHKLKLAGTVDCVAEHDGILSIIDFKTSMRLKQEEWVFNYFLQCCAYACMVYECYGIKIKQMVVIIAVDSEKPQVFVKDIGLYIEPLFDVIKRFRIANRCLL